MSSNHQQRVPDLHVPRKESGLPDAEPEMAATAESLTLKDAARGKVRIGSIAERLGCHVRQIFAHY